MTRRRLPREIPAQALGLTDQAIASGSNFVVIILLGRSLEPAAFGYFVLAFTLLQSAGAVQSALITRPHNVLGALRQGEDYVRYTTASALMQLGYATGWGALLLAIAGVAWSTGSPSATLFLLAAPAAVAWQLQEFGRRVLYTEGRLHLALLDDLVSYGAQAAILFALAATGALTGARALVVVAGTSAVAALLVAPFLRRSFAPGLDRDALRTNWRFGRWLGAAEVAYWVASQSYIYIGGLLVGPVVSAVLKAAQTLLGPVSVFLAFFVNYLPTVFARSSLDRAGGFARRIRVAFLTTVPATVLYGVLAVAFAPTLLRVVYGDDYVQYATVVRLFAAYYVILSVSDVFIAALAAQGRTREIFVGHAAGAVVSLALGWVLLLHWHATGGAAGMIVSILGALALFARAFGSGLRRQSSPSARSHSAGESGGVTSAKLEPRG
jgi:O-antigen/teichoic acid export membrane protein